MDSSEFAKMAAAFGLDVARAQVQAQEAASYEEQAASALHHAEAADSKDWYGHEYSAASAEAAARAARGCARVARASARRAAESGRILGRIGPGFMGRMGTHRDHIGRYMAMANQGLESAAIASRRATSAYHAARRYARRARRMAPTAPYFKDVEAAAAAHAAAAAASASASAAKAANS